MKNKELIIKSLIETKNITKTSNILGEKYWVVKSVFKELGFSKKRTEKIETENLKSFSNIRKRIFEERGRKCEQCGWCEVNQYNGFIPVQIDHLDGNRKNNKPENLKILCPNCHSLSKHFMFYGRKHKN